MTILRTRNRATALALLSRINSRAGCAYADVGHDADGWFVLVPGLRHPDGFLA